MYFMKFQHTISPMYKLKQCSIGFRNKLSTLCKSVSLDKGSSTCSSYDHMTEEWRKKMSAARELYLEMILSATKGDINDFGTTTSHKSLQGEPQGTTTSQESLQGEPQEVPEAEFNDETKKYKYPFENLVLKGGGVKCIAYCGLIKVLEKHGIMQQMKRFAGTSAGAITAALLAVGYNSYDLEKVLCVDFKKLVYDSTKLMYPLNLYRGYGVNTGKRFDRFIGDLLALKTGNPNVTFEEVYDRFNKELCLVVANVHTSEEMYCHVKTTPEMTVQSAVRMSMSIPFLFQAVKHKHYYFVDGGLLCNYPIHCFDGSFLSMERENNLPKDMCPENRFKYDPKNKTTIGSMVYCAGEDDLHKEKLKHSTGVRFGKLPVTVLAKKYEEEIAPRRKLNKVYEETVKAVVEFERVLRENELSNGRIIKKGFMAAFNTPSFTAEYKKLLFGDECEPEMLWKAVDKYGHGEPGYAFITIFLESIKEDTVEKLEDHKRKYKISLSAIINAFIDMRNKSMLKHFYESKDVERSVGINAWYIQTTDFKLEEEDKKFLTNQGRGSTRNFLKFFLENNDLKKLTEEEMNDIVIPTNISVDIRKLEKIIDL